MNYLNKYKLIPESQSGFRQKHSCQTADKQLCDQDITTDECRRSLFSKLALKTVFQKVQA